MKDVLEENRDHGNMTYYTDSTTLAPVTLLSMAVVIANAIPVMQYYR